MNLPPEIESPEDMKRWIVHHHTEDSLKWQEQEKLHADTETRLRALEWRIVLLASATAKLFGL